MCRNPSLSASRVHCGEETRNSLAEWCRGITIGSCDIWSTGHPGVNRPRTSFRKPGCVYWNTRGNRTAASVSSRGCSPSHETWRSITCERNRRQRIGCAGRTKRAWTFRHRMSNRPSSRPQEAKMPKESRPLWGRWSQSTGKLFSCVSRKNCRSRRLPKSRALPSRPFRRGFIAASRCCKPLSEEAPMPLENHEKARFLLHRALVEGISLEDRCWLDAHVGE